MSPEYRALVIVYEKEEFFDSYREKFNEDLIRIGFPNASIDTIGKTIRFNIKAKSKRAAKRQIKEMSETLFANPVIETFRIDSLEIVKQSKST